MKISIKTIERRMALVSGIGQEFHLREITGMLTSWHHLSKKIDCSRRPGDGSSSSIFRMRRSFT
jgi:hypothetical protein